jgi:hypothetical protein
MSELYEVRRGRPSKDSAEGQENIMIQLRKAVSLRGEKEVYFADGSKDTVSPSAAKRALMKFSALKTSKDKLEFSTRIATSVKAFHSALGESFRGMETGYIDNFFQYDGSRAAKSLVSKARNHKVSEEIIFEVYSRGMDSHVEGTMVTPSQLGFARVNSYLEQGHAFLLDFDLAEAGGAGEFGTTVARQRYAADTPGQSEDILVADYGLGKPEIADSIMAMRAKVRQESFDKLKRKKKDDDDEDDDPKDDENQDDKNDDSKDDDDSDDGEDDKKEKKPNPFAKKKDGDDDDSGEDDDGEKKENPFAKKKDGDDEEGDEGPPARKKKFAGKSAGPNKKDEPSSKMDKIELDPEKDEVAEAARLEEELLSYLRKWSSRLRAPEEYKKAVDLFIELSQDKANKRATPASLAARAGREFYNVDARELVHLLLKLNKDGALPKNVDMPIKRDAKIKRGSGSRERSVGFERPINKIAARGYHD